MPFDFMNRPPVRDTTLREDVMKSHISFTVWRVGRSRLTGTVHRGIEPRIETPVDESPEVHHAQSWSGCLERRPTLMKADLSIRHLGLLSVDDVVLDGGSTLSCPEQGRRGALMQLARPFGRSRGPAC